MSIGDALASRAPASRDDWVLGAPAAAIPVAAAVIAAAFATFPFERAAVLAFAGAVLVVVSAIDLGRGVIPGRLVVFAACAVLAAQIALFPARSPEWLLAAVLAAVALMLPRILKAAWMGTGDVKLAFLLGATLGWAVLGAVFVAFMCVFPVALALLVRHGKAAQQMTIPFGPFLALGTLVVLFGPPLAGFPAG